MITERPIKDKLNMAILESFKRSKNGESSKNVKNFRQSVETQNASFKV